MHRSRIPFPCVPFAVTLAMAGLLSVPASAQVFAGTDVVLDPNTGLEWLRVSESVGRSYDDLVGADGSNEFAAGGDFAGFRHATVAEAEDFLGNAGFDVLGAPSAALFDEALSLILRLGGPTFVSGGLERIFALTATSSIAPGSRDRILISLDDDAGTGDAGVNGAFDEAVASAAHGHLLVREAAPLPEQRHAYVARNGEAGVAVIDLSTNTVIDTVPTLRRAVALAVSPDQTRVYALNLSDSSVSVIDTETRSVVSHHSITTTGTPRGLAVSADGGQLFITDQADPGGVLVIDAVTGAEIDSVAVDPFPYGIRRSADGSQMYVSSPNTLEISVIDVASLTTVATSNANFAQFDLAVGESSGAIYSARSAVVYEVDPVALISPVDVGVGADTRGVSVSERIGRVFTSSNDDATVSVVDIESFSVVATIPTGSVQLFGGILAPGIEATEEGDLVYAAQGNNDTVVAIDTLSNEVIAEIPAGDTPVDVVFVPEPAANGLGLAAALSLIAVARSRVSRGMN